MKKTLSFMLIFSMILAMFTGIFTINAGAKVVTDAGNDWYGDQLSVNITAGTDGYNYMALFREFCHGYEFGGNFLGDGEGPQTFVIIDTEKYDGKTWTADGLYAPGVSNYEVVYCCDVETMIVDGTYYKRLNLEDSEYYGPAAAAKIRTIVTNSYPYVTFEQMKAELAKNEYPYAEELTLTEVISAVQAAIWANANGMTAEDFRYVKSYRVSDNLQWGYPIHDISNEAGLDVKGKRVFATYEEVGKRIDSLVDYLLALDSTRATAEEVVITDLDIVNYAPVQAQNDTYTVALKVAINNSGSSAQDKIYISIYVDGMLDSIVPVELGKEVYELTVEAKANQEIVAEVSGTQFLPKGAYFYAPRPADAPESNDGIATSREVSQNLVGVSMGATAVHSEASVTLDVPEEVPVTFDVNIRKYSDKGDFLTGAGFSIYAIKGSDELLVGKYFVDDRGFLKVANLLPGTYAIEESVTPAGYKELAGRVTFTVNKKGEVENCYTPAGVTKYISTNTISFDIINKEAERVINPTKAVIRGEKYLDGKPADGFWFALTDEFGSEIDRTQCVNGNFSFSLRFDSEGVYRYSVSEIPGNDEDIIYDNNEFDVIIKVTEGETRYNASITYVGASGIAFYNKTVPPTEYTFEGSKYLDGVPAEGFEFAIIEGGEVISTATSDKNGKFYFTVDFPVVGDYNFQIAEIAGNDEMIVYDDRIYDIDVEVVIENGTLVATADDVEIVFNNLTVKPATVTFSGKNYLDLVPTAGFNFALKDGNKIVATATSDENGNFTLPALTFNRDGVYVYEFVEIAGGVDTIVYDESVYTITIVVTLDGDQLVADTKVDYLDDSHRAHFANRRGANVYDISGLDFYNWTIRTNARIEGTKYLDGKVAAGFEFVLTDKENNVIATATSDENGYFFFDVACTETGIFNYSVAEIAGTDESIIYDSSIIDVTVTVTRVDVDLVAEVTGTQAVVFNNQTVPETTEPEEEITEEPTPLDPTPETTEPETTEPETTEPEEEITEPEIPLDPNPKTGDTSILLVIAAIASIALAVLYFKRREVTEE